MSQDELPPTSVLFERHGAMVFRRCLGILRSEEEARDAVQEVFLNVLGRRSQFQGQSSPASWLYGAATLHCLQKLRNRERREHKLQELVRTPREQAEPPLDDRLTLESLLDVESSELRLIVYCRYVDDMNLDEVAEVVGRSRKTVSNHLKAFLEQARERLQPGDVP
jgi:RNA polymerase sigma-70 factor (ECF subfamily)